MEVVVALLLSDALALGVELDGLEQFKPFLRVDQRHVL